MVTVLLESDNGNCVLLESDNGNCTTGVRQC
jgi:hypothetical protein